MVNTKQIFKNSLWLYLRMLLVTGVALYTSRVVLKELGVEDFGIYNVTGSLVAFLSVLTTTMSNSTQRFLNIKKGEGDIESMETILGVSINIHKIISWFIVLLAETVGLYFVLKILVIPENKQFDAFWCYQSTILTLLFTFFRIPYMSLAVTYERFAFIAWTSLTDVTIKLVMAFALECFESHRLIYYGFSFSLMAILQFWLFKWYCNKILVPKAVIIKDTYKCDECRFLLSFSSWNILGNVANVMANQGISIILNIFYSVVVNAALGITNQVTNTIATFINNVQQAFRPQLLQTYADDKSSFLSLLYSTSRWSFFLMLLISVPLICNIKYILLLWLGSYPEYTDSFITILVGFLLVDSLGTPLLNGIEANGNIKRFQLIQSALYIINVFFAWGMSLLDLSPNVAILTKLITNIFILLFKCVELKKVEKAFFLRSYVQNVVVKILPLFVFCLIYIYLSSNYLQDSIYKLLFTTSIFLLTYLILLFYIGLTKEERIFCILKLKRTNKNEDIEG